MAKIGKNNKFSGGNFERFTKRRLTEQDAENRMSRNRTNRPKRQQDDFFSTYEEDSMELFGAETTENNE
jgi:hypothetical protein